MLARLILAVLFAAFATPVAAPAACHDTAMAPMTMPAHRAIAGAGDRPAQAPDKIAPAHGCIGCVPPSDWQSARVVEPVPARAALLVETALRLDLGRAPEPARRPPRAG